MRRDDSVAATVEPRKNAALYELERRLEQEERNIATWERSLIEAIEKEKRAHEEVERMKTNLNGSVQARMEIEDALRRLRALHRVPSGDRSVTAPRNPDVTDVGCPSCDYGVPTACTCEEESDAWEDDDAE